MTTNTWQRSFTYAKTFNDDLPHCVGDICPGPGNRSAPTAAIYTPGPDSLPNPGTPKGVTTKYVLPPGKFYPGTPHNYQVYVPAQYDAAKPTPFMIFLDGGGSVNGGPRVPVVFDNLIAKKEIPAMIGIFIDPGVLPARSPRCPKEPLRTNL